MPTLKEIKGRIGSVQNTLKITSAMKLVSSAKLHKAQAAIANMRPYEAHLQRILAVVSGGERYSFSSAKKIADATEKEYLSPTNIADATGNALFPPARETDRPSSATVIVAIASNSSLCGGFNANAIAKVKELLRAYPKATVYSIGRKMADAMRKAGYPSPADYSALSEHPSYGPADELASGLMKEVEEGRVGKVFLVYNHFVSSARQEPTVEVLVSGGGENSLSSAKKIADATEREFSPANIADATEREFSPANIADATEREFSPANIADATEREFSPANDEKSYKDYILEPSAKEIRKRLYPKTIKLRLYATLLDSAAAEHAARTVAMQTATDNGEDLLDELTLQYNKGRQQKITSEILDLASGQQ